MKKVNPAEVKSVEFSNHEYSTSPPTHDTTFAIRIRFKMINEELLRDDSRDWFFDIGPDRRRIFVNLQMADDAVKDFLGSYWENIPYTFNKELVEIIKADSHTRANEQNHLDHNGKWSKLEYIMKQSILPLHRKFSGGAILDNKPDMNKLTNEQKEKIISLGSGMEYKGNKYKIIEIQDDVKAVIQGEEELFTPESCVDAIYNESGEYINVTLL